jgi:predicted Mrr-cat superfamily restriction endonuclease
MSRGKQAELGKETVNANGYTMVKTASGWRLKQHLVAEEKLGRDLKPDERVVFADNDRTNFAHDNIIVRVKQIRVSQTYDRRRSSIEDKVMQFVEESDDRHRALEDVRDILNDARLAHGFGVI